MTPARPEPAAYERIAAVQQQADLARLARFPAARRQDPNPGGRRMVIEPRREARTPPRRQLRVTRRQHRRRLPSPVDRRSPSGRLLPY
jgi:hypothetical protein